MNSRYWFILALLAGIWLWLMSLSLQHIWHSLDLGWAVVAGLLLYFGTALLDAYRTTRPPRLPIFLETPEEVGFTYEEVHFLSRDGVQLEGWFVPPTNGRTIILGHGFGENRLGSLPVARWLVKAGFGVLLFDWRAHGRSQGTLSSWGWRETDDLAGAVAYVQTRPEVNPYQLGVYGFSLGGQIALRYAAGQPLIKAVVVDSPAVATLADHQIPRSVTFRALRQLPWLWVVYGVQSLLLGLRPPAGVLASVPQLTQPTLFIATGSRQELFYTLTFYQAKPQPKSLWEVPEVGHGEGPLKRPEEYEQKLVKFFLENIKNDPKKVKKGENDANAQK